MHTIISLCVETFIYFLCTFPDIESWWSCFSYTPPPECCTRCRTSASRCHKLDRRLLQCRTPCICNRNYFPFCWRRSICPEDRGLHHRCQDLKELATCHDPYSWLYGWIAADNVFLKASSCIYLFLKFSTSDPTNGRWKCHWLNFC